MSGDKAESGARLGPSASQAPVTSDAAGELRQVTVLFADLVGFTAYSEQSGEEAAYSLMQRISTLLTRTRSRSRRPHLISPDFEADERIGPERRAYRDVDRIAASCH
jgi:hypothetical protein